MKLDFEFEEKGQNFTKCRIQARFCVPVTRFFVKNCLEKFIKKLLRQSDLVALNFGGAETCCNKLLRRKYLIIFFELEVWSSALKYGKEKQIQEFFHSRETDSRIEESRFKNFFIPLKRIKFASFCRK